ncbi:MAG: hypothetical protein MSA13_07195 [Prevotella sp.]|nr:hypothetical protein [Prevotella sp.]
MCGILNKTPSRTDRPCLRQQKTQLMDGRKAADSNTFNNLFHDSKDK